MKELRDNLGQLIFWGIAFGILLGILSLAGCETPKKSNCKQETTLPNNNNIHCEVKKEDICMSSQMKGIVVSIMCTNTNKYATVKNVLSYIHEDC